VPLSAYVVDCGVYVDGKRLSGRWTHDDGITEVRRRDSGFVWIGLHEPDAEQIQGISATFKLHELAVEDAVHAHQRPKLDLYPGQLFMVLKTVRYVPDDTDSAVQNEIVETGEIMVFLGDNYIVTVRHGNHSGLSSLRRSLEAQPETLELGPAVVLHNIADQVVDSYLDVSAKIEADIDDLEARVFAPRSIEEPDEIYLMKREVLELKRSVMPLVAGMKSLAHTENPLVPTSVQLKFRDVEDHLTTVVERITAFDEMLSSLLDAAVAKISLQQNTDMRKIASWAAIITVPTMIAGIYGMNFDFIPELHYKYGYPVVLLVMIGVCAFVYRILRKNKWL
jgi:magnesium transporter